MFSWFKNVDALLRGDLRSDSQRPIGTIDFPLGRVVVLSILLAMIYGACIGSFTAVSAKTPHDGWMQLLASTVKAPLLFYLTLLVTFPSLYVFNALMGSRLDVLAALRLLVASISVMVSILASLGPIIVFFAFSTPGGKPGYRFILMLVVVLSTTAGVLGLSYLLRMLNEFTQIHEHSATARTRIPAEPAALPVPVEPSSDDANDAANVAGAASPESARANQVSEKVPKRTSWSSADEMPKYPASPAKIIFRVWVFVFAIVGAQMSWVLRPFVGSPDLEFTWFRERSGNFFQSVYHIIWQLLSGQ